MKIRTLVKILAASFVALVALGIATVLIANWSDDALTPAAQKLLRGPPVTAPDASNGYFVQLGIFAPEGTDALEAGRRIHAAYMRQYQEDPSRLTFTSDEPVFGESPRQMGNDKTHCPLQGIDCVAFYLENRDVIRTKMDADALLRARYAQIAALPAFEERVIPSITAPIPPYVPLSSSAEENLAEAVFRIDAGDAAGGLDMIAREMALHRRLLAASRTFISKSINAAMLRRDYEVLSQSIEHWPDLIHNQAAALDGLLQPLTAKERGDQNVFSGEGMLSASILMNAANEPSKPRSSSGSEAAEDSFDRLANRAARFLFLPNASVNMSADYWNMLNLAAAGDAAGLDARKARFIKDFNWVQANWVSEPWRYIRNPMGKILVAIGTGPDLNFAYIERVHDLDGYIRLARLQVALHRQNVTADKVVAFVQQASPEMRNPYNGAAMGWDAATSTLVFLGRQNASANAAGEKKTHRIKMRFS